MKPISAHRPLARRLLGILVTAASASLLVAAPASGAVASSEATAQDRVTRSELVTRATHLQFDISLAHFLKVKNHPKGTVDSKFTWADNGCSAPFDAITAYWQAVFERSCKRHDFGYRNFGHGLSLGSNDATKRRIDSRLLSDMRKQCSNYGGDRASCYAVAQTFYEAVLHFGDAQTAFYARECLAHRFCLFDDTGYEDRRIALASSENNMNDIDFGDKTSSVKNRQSVSWLIFDDHDYSDRSLCIRPGVNVPRLSDYDFNDKTSSAKRLSGTGCPAASMIASS